MTSPVSDAIPDPVRASAPHEPYGRLFLRFLRFGMLAWGGPVAQIAMIRQELVEEEKWISRERFNRVLSILQVLPGPEAHEFCVYLGVLSRGRIGGLLAGLGFMLPGFVLMLILSWAYASFGADSPILAAVSYGCKAAVVALIIRAIHRIGQHALTNAWLWGIAVAAGLASLLGANFLLTLPVAGLVYSVIKRATLPAGAALLPIPLWLAAGGVVVATPLALFGYGLRSGLLTFGGAYTVITFLQHDAVVQGGWMSNAQFLDGLALSGILPAPLIIFATFVGYLGGGLVGALALTAGIFLPAFGFSLIGHRYIERLVENKGAHAFLDGITAGVVGLVAATAIGLFREAIVDAPTLIILGTALLALYRWRARAAVVGIMFGAAALGLLMSH